MIESVATIGEKIKRRRVGMGLTQVRLAEMSGVKQNTISKIERDQLRTIPTPPTLKKLADALGVTVYDLIDE